MRYYIKAFKNYFESDGRATRKEIWLFFVFHILFIFITSFFDALFGLYGEYMEYGYLTIAYLLIAAGPTICLQVRRFHDVDRSGKWWFAIGVPIISIYTFYLLFLKAGTAGENRFGRPGESGTANRKNGEPVNSPSAAHYAAGSAVTAETETEAADALPQSSSAPIKPRANFCRNCGARLIYGGRFCPECGTEIAD